MAKQIEFWTLFRLTQEYASQHYAAALTDKSKLSQLRSYIDKYLRDNDYHVENTTKKTIQLGETVRFTVSYQSAVKGLGVFFIPVTLTVKESGLSEKYWK